MHFSLDRIMNIFDDELSVGSNEVVTPFFVESKSLDVEVVLDVCLGKHGDVLEFDKQAVIGDVGTFSVLV